MQNGRKVQNSPTILFLSQLLYNVNLMTLEKEGSLLTFIPALSRWISHMWLFTGMRKWKLSRLRREMGGSRWTQYLILCQKEIFWLFFQVSFMQSPVGAGKEWSTKISFSVFLCLWEIMETAARCIFLVPCRKDRQKSRF